MRKVGLIFAISIVFLVGFAFASNAQAYIVYGVGIPAGEGDLTGPDGTGVGYAWNENIGWIKFSGTTGAGGTYEVHKSVTGLLSGYAWSEHVGWVAFSKLLEGTICPDGSACQASVVNGKITGWARITSMTTSSGNYGGWIKFDGNNPAYVNDAVEGPVGPEFDGDYGWGGDPTLAVNPGDTGWTHVNSSSPSNPDFKICVPSDTAWPAYLSIKKGQTGTLAAWYSSDTEFTCENPEAIAADVTGSTVWQSDKEYIATVSSGTVTAQDFGINAIITGTYSSLSDNARVDVYGCGNAEVESGEQCDLGDASHGDGNGACPKLCSSTCTTNTCPTGELKSGGFKETR